MEYGTCFNTGFNLEYANMNPDDESCHVVSLRQNLSFTKSFLQREFYIKDNCPNKVIGNQIFHGYSLFDALSLRNASQLHAKKRKISDFTSKSILANYGGVSLFSVF